jgi:hypothetical protein
LFSGTPSLFEVAESPFFRRTRFAALVSLALSSCAADPCDVANPCTSDPKPSAAEIQACRDSTSNGVKCAAQQQAYTDCFNAHRVCGADHTTDLARTSASCDAQAQALRQCMM